MFLVVSVYYKGTNVSHLTSKMIAFSDITKTADVSRGVVTSQSDQFSGMEQSL